MEIWETLLISLLIAVILPIAFSFFWFFKIRGENKISSEEIIRTRPPKTFSGFFLGFALIVLLGGIAGIIYCCIKDSENTTPATVLILIDCVYKIIFNSSFISSKQTSPRSARNNKLKQDGFLIRKKATEISVAF